MKETGYQRPADGTAAAFCHAHKARASIKKRRYGQRRDEPSVRENRPSNAGRADLLSRRLRRWWTDKARDGL